MRLALCQHRRESRIPAQQWPPKGKPPGEKGTASSTGPPENGVAQSNPQINGSCRLVTRPSKEAKTKPVIIWS
jgi:hypothetical protein